MPIFKKSGKKLSKRYSLLNSIVYHLLDHKLSVMDLISELCEIQGITFSVFEPIKLASKKILKIHDFLALNNARFK